MDKEVASWKREPALRFILIALCLIIMACGGAGGFYLWQASFDDFYDRAAEYVQVCVSAAAQDSILESGMHAGFGGVLPTAVITSNVTANVLYGGAQVLLRSDEDIRHSLEAAIQMRVRDCVENAKEYLRVDWSSFRARVGSGVYVAFERPMIIQTDFFGREYIMRPVRVPFDTMAILGPVRDILGRVSAGGVRGLQARYPGYAIRFKTVSAAGNATIFVVEDVTNRIFTDNYRWVFATT